MYIPVHIRNTGRYCRTYIYVVVSGDIIYYVYIIMWRTRCLRDDTCSVGTQYFLVLRTKSCIRQHTSAYVCSGHQVLLGVAHDVLLCVSVGRRQQT